MLTDGGGEGLMAPLRGPQGHARELRVSPAHGTEQPGGAERVRAGTSRISAPPHKGPLCCCCCRFENEKIE